MDIPNPHLDRIKDRTIREGAWTQLLMTMQFWVKDTSAGFEKTDIFIEKSVKASFDLLDITPVKSLIDLGKFIYKEKFQFNG